MCIKIPLKREFPVLRLTHELKTWPESFQAIWEGFKKYELRRNDRDFNVGDQLFLREYDPVTKKYSGRCILVSIVFMTVSSDFPGLQDDYVVMGIKMEDKGIEDA